MTPPTRGPLSEFPPRRFLVNFVDGTAEFNDDSTPPAQEYVSLMEHETSLRASLALNAEMLEALNAEMLGALKALRNETKGTLRAHEMAIRYDSGNSNWTCLEMALAMADAAIQKAEST